MCMFVGLVQWFVLVGWMVGCLVDSSGLIVHYDVQFFSKSASRCHFERASVCIHEGATAYASEGAAV